MKSASKTIFVTILTDATRGIHVDQENNINAAPKSQSMR